MSSSSSIEEGQVWSAARHGVRAAAAARRARESFMMAVMWFGGEGEVRASVGEAREARSHKSE